MLDFAKDNSPGDVPDPYYSDDGFEVVLDLIEDASRGLLAHIRDRHL
jgi:protein-tyrosine phosphatase